ncbi:U6 snRNP-associated protein Lsm7 [Hypoxylon texense]
MVQQPLGDSRDASESQHLRDVGSDIYDTASAGFPALSSNSLTTYPGDLANIASRSSAKKSLNVDSPSFTPTQLGGKKSNFSTNATPFTPRGANSSTTTALQQDTGASLYKSAPFPEFAPQNYDLNTATTTNGSTDSGSLGFDPFSMSTVSQALPSTPYNPYAEDHNALAGAGAPYYTAQNSYTAPSQPLQYHMYYPITTAREHLQPYQRQVYDLFLPENIREDLQKKSEAARQVLQPGVHLPSLQHYHSLVPLDTKIRGATNTLGLPSWVFKATSRKNGNVFCLRRIEGFRLTNEEAIKAVNSWKKIIHPNIVTTIEAFTTRDFNDSSLVFVHSYHPLSKTLAEHHFSTNRFGRPTAVPERILWSYLVQLASALKAIHKAKLAARCIDVSKVILTEKNRIRLSACSIQDVLHFEVPRRVEELQQEDFFSLGRLILSIATNTPPRNLGDFRLPLEQLGRTYSMELKERISWLLSPPQSITAKTAEHLVYDLAQHADDVLVASLDTEDELTTHLGRELENGRLVRLVAKLGSINERPEFDGDPNWAETAERYTLKLFRDYVFHQVDAQGNPVVDLGHIISCLNKLDAGIDEKIYLTSRDHQSTFVVSYKELKKQLQGAFSELLKAGSKPQANRGY